LVQPCELCGTENNIFAQWSPNDESQFSELFNRDNNFFGFHYILTPDHDTRFQKHLYEQYYPGLFYIFLAQQAKSMVYPGISWMELNNMISLCNIFTPDWSEAEIDRIYDECIQSIKLTLKNVTVKHDYDPMQHGLLRCGFVSYMARIAIERFYKCNFCT
jgi:hypothetical protein